MPTAGRARSLSEVIAKVVADLRRDLVVGHLVDGFDADDSLAESFARNALFELVLCLARPEDQDRFRVAQMPDDFVVVPAQMDRELPVALVVRGARARDATPG